MGVYKLVQSISAMVNLTDSPYPGRRYRCHSLSLQRIDLVITTVTSLLANHPVASESERIRDQCQSPAVIQPVNLSFSFLFGISRHKNLESN